MPTWPCTAPRRTAGSATSSSTSTCTTKRCTLLDTRKRPAPRAAAPRVRALLPADRPPVRRQRCVGYEALLRWHHPQRGLVLPGRFPGRRRGHRQHRADRLADVRACLPRHPAPGRWTARYVSLNVSPRHFRSPTSRERLLALLDALQGVQPAACGIEVTEGALLENPDQVHWPASPAARCRRADARSTISAPAIRRCPTCTGSRCTHSRSTAPSSPNCEPDLQAAAARRWSAPSSLLAGSLGLEVIAEGIETEAQREAPAASSIARVGQGFLFAHARPAAEWQALEA